MKYFMTETCHFIYMRVSNDCAYSWKHRFISFENKNPFAKPRQKKLSYSSKLLNTRGLLRVLHILVKTDWLSKTTSKLKYKEQIHKVNHLKPKTLYT